AVGDHHAELQRAEARLRRRVRLQEVPDLLIDGDALGPAGRRVGAALDVAGEQLDAGQEAAHAAHVRVAVAAHLVADAVQDEGALAERLQRREALLERELLALLVGPERRRHDAVGAEHHDEPLLPALLVGEAQARQVEDERQRRRADPHVADELAAAAGPGHGVIPLEDRGQKTEDRRTRAKIGDQTAEVSQTSVLCPLFSVLWSGRRSWRSPPSVYGY